MVKGSTRGEVTDRVAVGGEILDMALGQAKLRGRIVKCGSELKLLLSSYRYSLLTRNQALVNITAERNPESS